MFKKAVKEALNYIRPFLIGRLIYKDKHISNDISTMIILNKNGDILTTAKNADIFTYSKEYNETFPPILKEISEAKPKNIPKIEKKYGLEPNTIVGMQNIIIDVAKNPGSLEIIKHPYLDLAIIHIKTYDKLLVDSIPKFAKKRLSIGESVCTIGFAYPEYEAFKYDNEKFKITSNYTFMNFPAFPTDGIIQRHIIDKENNISMYEMSNLIALGQEGGPVLNKKGLICGMICGFKAIQDFAGTIRIGIAINNEAIMKFLDEHNIKYEVENEKE